MNLGWFLRMSRWARNPPSGKRALMLLAIIGFCLLLYAIETFFGWPEALTPKNSFRGGVPR